MATNDYFVIAYGKIIEDKEDGIYLSGVFFGGIAYSQNDADLQARHCVNTIRGGIIIPKVFKATGKHALIEVLSEANEKFVAMERTMIEAEFVMERNASRRKK